MERFSIKKLTREDAKTIDSIRPENWSDISIIHKFYVTNKACGCIKIINEKNDIIGIGTGIFFQKSGWLAHIIVSKEFRNRGIGGDIVRDRIDFLQNKKNCTTITLTATDLGYPLYKKLGFTDESLYMLLGRKNEYVAENKSPNIIPIEPRHYKEIFNIDRTTSGEDRKELLKEIIKSGYAYVKKDHVSGFYLPGFGDGGISALTEEAGLELLKLRMAESGKIFIPEENKTAYNFLLANGYTEEKQIHRMIIGEAFERNPQYCYSRIGGFAG